MITHRLTTTIIGVALFVAIIIFVRRGRLQEKYSLVWFGTGILIVILGAFPTIVDRIAWVFGIHYPPALLLIAAVGILLIHVLYLSTLVSRDEVRIRELIRQVVVLNKLVEELRGDTDSRQKGGP